MKTPNQRASHGVGLWWFVLISGTTFSIVLNLWHALTMTGEKTHAILGIIFAIVPAAFAALLSHGLVNPDVGTGMQWVILMLFVISMLTSITSQAAVLRPYGGGYGAEWSVPLVLDASALIALHFITKATKTAREVARHAEAEADLNAIRAELRPSVEAEVRVELEAELAAAEAELRAEFTARQAELTAEATRNYEAEVSAVRTQSRAELEAELTAARADMEEELTRRQGVLETEFATRLAQTEADLRRRSETECAERVRRAEVETEGRIRLEFAQDTKPKTKGDTPAAKTADTPLSRQERAELLKAKARILLQQRPNINGAELGRALKVSDRYGRDLLREMAEEKPGESSPASGSDVRL
ncbi:hypothetical protein OG339_48135 (plasmid) [Streptosporangium sp. NBC_01495]|uniref:hypothetical protein n=1 Tax=Streptosporangium sp. NBC_01495 TaxID=2903899 RepID=UPI002E2F17CA|nr:hypothetical protein [Streptosporangium sp. NBC_01495]